MGTDDTQAHCLYCNHHLGYTSDGKGGCLLNKKELCDDQNTIGQCVKCKIFALPFNGQCISYPLTTECLLFNRFRLCARCPVGSHPNPIRVPFDANDRPDDCVPNEPDQDPRCLVPGDGQKCLVCTEGNYLQNDACYPQLPNCLINSGLSCASCRVGFRLKSKTSLQYDNKAVATKYLLASFFQYGTIYPISDYCELDPEDLCQNYDPQTHLCTKCKPGNYLS